MPHYWLLDPETGTLNVFRREPQGYLNVLIADRHQRVLAESFDALEVTSGFVPISNAARDALEAFGFKE